MIKTQIHRQHMKPKFLLPPPSFNSTHIYVPYNLDFVKSNNFCLEKNVSKENINPHPFRNFPPFKPRDQLLKSNSNIHERLIKLKTENLVYSQKRICWIWFVP